MSSGSNTLNTAVRHIDSACSFTRFGFEEGPETLIWSYQFGCLHYHCLEAYRSGCTTVGEMCQAGLKGFLRQNQMQTNDWNLRTLYQSVLSGDPALPLPPWPGG